MYIRCYIYPIYYINNVNGGSKLRLYRNVAIYYHVINNIYTRLSLNCIKIFRIYLETSLTAHGIPIVQTPFVLRLSNIAICIVF